MDIERKEAYIKAAMAHSDIPITPLSIHKIALLAAEVFFPKRSQIINDNNAGETVYLITDGLARSYYLDAEGRDLTKNFFLEGDFVNDEALFTSVRSEAIESVEEIRSLGFDARQLKALLLKEKDLLLLYTAILEETLQYKITREYAFQSEDAVQRYQRFQARFAKAETRIPQYQIASYIGVAKESLSRIRHNLQNH